MGLAEETTPGSWRIAPDLEPTLRQMGDRSDIIKTMRRELKAAGIERAASDHAIFDPASDGRVVGRLVAEGFSDELRERRYVIVDGVDGRTHYVELGLWNADDARLVRNTIIELRTREIAPRAVDRTIAEIASRNHGLYSIGLHGAVDPDASAEFIQTYVRRLEAMRRQGLAERLADGAWRVLPDHLDRAARFEEANRLQRPVRTTVLSWQNLEALPNAVGATWLDRQLVAKAPETIAPTGMGSETGAALRARRKWLLDQGLAREQGGRIAYAQSVANLGAPRTCRGRRADRQRNRPWLCGDRARRPAEWDLSADADAQQRPFRPDRACA
jgi:elongation factor P hydroxylase